MLLSRIVLYCSIASAVFVVGIVERCAAGTAEGAEPLLKTMSFNIRFGTAPDGENAWPLRRELVLETINAYAPDIVGLQEALKSQLDELVEAMPQFGSVGCGRDADGEGEYSAILYRRKRFDVVNVGNFWLSETPSEPGSTSWGNQLPRICTWMRVFDHQAARRYYVFNTHWDHQSQPAREQSGRAIADRVAQRESSPDPVIVMGDFNAGETNPARQPLLAIGLRDAFRVLHPEASPVGTFNGFKGRLDGEKIDTVFVSQHWKVLEATIDRTEREGRYPSDHFPVTATLTLEVAE